MTIEEIMRRGREKFPPDFIEEIRDDGSTVRTDVNATIRHAYIQGLIDNNYPLPAKLDEAAEKYSENILANNEDLQDAIEDAFKEGAKWMAGQGETKQGVVIKDDFIQFADNTYIDLDPKLELTPAFALKDAKEVVVQVRKKQ